MSLLPLGSSWQSPSLLDSDFWKLIFYIYWVSFHSLMTLNPKFNSSWPRQSSFSGFHLFFLLGKNEPTQLAKFTLFLFLTFYSLNILQVVTHGMHFSPTLLVTVLNFIHNSSQRKMHFSDPFQPPPQYCLSSKYLTIASVPVPTSVCFLLGFLFYLSFTSLNSL
jgi:hypothetical protein